MKWISGQTWRSQLIITYIKKKKRNLTFTISENGSCWSFCFWSQNYKENPILFTLAESIYKPLDFLLVHFMAHSYTSYVYVFLVPVSLRELSLLSLWSSSAITAGSCFFLCFEIVFVVIDPIFSNATYKKKQGIWILNT